jgi:alkanesulfonate monooxygenase SsuD/methylene tetrahydromethanopterin reductase-like flavin-dependent oxidoreductase (luciferase family)
MAANGPKAMCRAGQYGDGLVTDPKIWQQQSAFESNAKAAGKDPSHITVQVELYAVVGEQHAAEAAAQLWSFGPRAFKAAPG